MKPQIYQLMNELADQGKAIIMISSELEELMGMADRIGVIYEGHMAGEVEKKDFNQKTIVALASGLTKEKFA